MRRNLVVLAICLSAAGVLIMARPESPQIETKTQSVRSQKGKPLFSLLRPGVTDVLVEKDQATPHYVQPPPGMAQLEWMVSLSPIVALIRVETVEAMLTIDQDWIESTVFARVEEILKKPLGDPLLRGDSIQFVQDGGEMLISGVRLRAVLPWTEGLRPGAQYLVFARREDDGWQIDSGTAYEITPAHQELRPLARRGKAPSEAGVPLDVATARIRAAIQRPK